MEFRSVVEKRASVRQFTGDPVSADDLREMVRLAGLSPSVNNSQPWQFIAITNKDVLRRMADAVHAKIGQMLPDKKDEAAARAKNQVDFFSTFFADAPAVVAVAMCPYEAIVDRVIAGTQLTHEEMNAVRGHPDIQSIGAAVQTLILAAVDMGYGTCWLSGPLIARQEIEQCLGIQGNWQLAAMVALGRPAGSVSQRPKKAVDEILRIVD
jgi:nitroreductase